MREMLDVADDLRELSAHMEHVAKKMDDAAYLCWDGDCRDKSKELLGASLLAKQWASYIEDCYLKDD